MIEEDVNTQTGELTRRADSPGGLLASDQQRVIAEVQAAMILAAKFRRDQDRAKDAIIADCKRQSLAEVGLYSYARGGTEISGLSIRAAEAMAQRWGNMQFGVRELEQLEGESIVQSYAWDLETNTKREQTFTVPHRRDTRDGAKALTDSRDIYELVANMGARRLRSCLLGVIPGDVQEAARAELEKTLERVAAVTPERVAKMLEFFAGYGVTQSQIEQLVQRKIESLTPKQMVKLIKISNSLKDGMSAPGDWFKGATKVVQTPQRRPAGSAQQADPDPSAAAPTADTPPHSPTQSGGGAAPEQQQAASEPAAGTANASAPAAPQTAQPAQNGGPAKPLDYKGQTVRILRVWQPNPANNGHLVETSDGLACVYSKTAIAALEEAAKSNAAVKFEVSRISYRQAPCRIDKVTLDLAATAKAAAKPAAMPAVGDIFGGQEREPGIEG